MSYHSRFQNMSLFIITEFPQKWTHTDCSQILMLNLLPEKFPGANDFESEVIPGATTNTGLLKNMSSKFSKWSVVQGP
ncbi:hypothetical protein L1887_30215 [Cichorium endivia]|nr:hypothetical protein L1887_30215 [Cichorium endivia]